MPEDIKYYYSLETKAFYTSESPGTMAAHGVAIEQPTEISDALHAVDLEKAPEIEWPVKPV